jgi:hypothetical protein
VEISDIRANLSLLKVDVSAFVPKALKRPFQKIERNGYVEAHLSVLFCEKHYNAPSEDGCLMLSYFLHIIAENGRYKREMQ